jgi:endonuclease G
MKKLFLVPILGLLSFMPQGDKRVEHKAFTASYNSNFRQSELVTYSVTAKRLEGKISRSIASFQVDPLEQSSHHTKDYLNSGFDRGHLAPAADMVWDKQAMIECFYTTNIAPQYPTFNRGVWKALEERVRKEAKERDSLVVYVGVIFDGAKKQGALWVPTAFYKVIHDPKENATVAFLFPHTKQSGNYSTYISTLAIIEKKAKRELLNVKKEYNNSESF